MLATSKMLKEGDRERFVAPDVNFLVVPTLQAHFMPTETLLCNKYILFSRTSYDREYAHHYTQRPA